MSEWLPAKPDNTHGIIRYKGPFREMQDVEHPEQVLEQAEALASHGLKKKDIMNYLKVRPGKDAMLAGALEASIAHGHAQANYWVNMKLMSAIDEGNLKAIMFYLKNRAGWVEKNEPNSTNVVMNFGSEGYGDWYAQRIQARQMEQEAISAEFTEKGDEDGGT